MSAMPPLFNAQDQSRFLSGLVNQYGLRNIVYYIRKDKENNYYFLEPYVDKIKVPSKIYGNLNKLAIRFWNNYVLEDKSTGVLLTGQAGSGKTELANILSNIAIDNNMPVIMVQDIEADIELISFINSLNNVVLLFDEFAKVFNYNLQEKMLSMFSNTNAGKRLYILTENNSGTVSEFIRNRPSRVKYHIDFSRIEKDVLIDYCNDHSVLDSFLSDLLHKYDASNIFSFDHLMALVTEHNRYPEDTLDDLLKILNLDVLRNPITLTLKKIYDKKTKKEVKFKPMTIPTEGFDMGFSYYIKLEESDRFNVKISSDDIVKIDDGVFSLEKDDLEITFQKNDNEKPSVEDVQIF